MELPEAMSAVSRSRVGTDRNVVRYLELETADARRKPNVRTYGLDGAIRLKWIVSDESLGRDRQPVTEILLLMRNSSLQGL